MSAPLEESEPRRRQVRTAQAKYRKANTDKRREYDKKRPRRQGAKRIVGVDGEGQDIFRCKQCSSLTSSTGGPCSLGGMHELTFTCTRCALTDPPADGECKRGGKHDIQVLADGHIYTYLAAVDETGRLMGEAYNENGLTHDQCAELILRLTKNSLRFGFMFSYDVTKIIEGMPESERFRLMRPAAREIQVCKYRRCSAKVGRLAKECSECGCDKLRRATEPLEWKGRSYDFFHGSLTITAPVNDKPRSSKIWDCFRFFGCAFVDALRDWSSCKVKGCGAKDSDGAGLMEETNAGDYQCVKCGYVVGENEEPPVATKTQIERIAGMKAKRGSFDVEDPESVKSYCREECHLLARMMRRLIDAHDRAGIPLTRYDGAGSTATSLLRANKVEDYKGLKQSDLDPELGHAIACSFFGGRFEDSVIGSVEVPCFGYDISSAYPYALTHLPCLRCGYWRVERNITPDKLRRLEAKGNLIVARFAVRHVPRAERLQLAWCPLPFRSDKGSITYGTNFTGWAWAPELLAAIRGWPDLVSLKGDAWIYEPKCDEQGCESGGDPFKFLPRVYRERMGWGKEGAGKVLKLGMNASYGKTAQSLGDDPPFQSWIWAGMTTATTRGQLLDAIASAKNQWNILAVATDGVFSMEPLPIKKPPKDTGTTDLDKPLGGWESKDIPEGIFLAKPGMYWSRAMKFVRARGIGRRELKECFEAVEGAFARWNRRDMEFSVEVKSRRFFGAKYSVSGRSTCSKCGKTFPGVPEVGCPKCRDVKGERSVGTSFTTKLLQTERGRDAYGTWDVRTIKVAFDPWPKRERVGIVRGGTYARIHIRDLDGAESAAYDVRGRKTTPEGEIARASKEFAMEQPDWDG